MVNTKVFFIKPNGLINASGIKVLALLLMVGGPLSFAPPSILAADTSKPTINLFISGIDEPHNAVVTSGSNVTAEVTDDTGVTKVDFYIDDVRYASDTTAPFGFFWNSTTDNMSQGPHTISGLAYDAAGNIGFDEFNETIYVNYATQFACAGTELICENFDSAADGANFTTSGGTWTVDGGVKIFYVSSPATAATGNANRAVHNTTTSGDFTLKTQANPSEFGGNPDFSVIWGYQDASNYYYASFSKNNDAGINGIFKIVGGVITELADFSTGVKDSGWYKVKVEKTGSTYRVYRNNSSMGVVTDSTFSDGKIGFGGRDNSVNFYYTTVVSGTPAAYVAPPVDSTPPIVLFRDPVNGATVSGANVRIRWAHVDDAAGANNAPAIVSRELLVDGVAQTVNVTEYIDWDSNTVPNGLHTITVNATDSSGNVGTDSITVTVANETTPPSVSITTPANGASVNDNVLISAAASDNLAVTKVEFYVDGVFKLADTSSPYQYLWSTVTLTNGGYTLQVKAFDAAGNNSTSSISVNVDNKPGHPDGALVHANGTVYLIDDSKRRAITSGEVFNSHGFDWNKIKPANLMDLGIPAGTNFSNFREGSLLAANGAIFVIDELPDGTSQKRGIASYDVFIGLGYRNSDFITVSPAALPAQNGSLISSANIHPDGTLIHNNGSVFKMDAGQRRPITSGEVFNSHGFDWNKIKPASGGDLAAPAGAAFSSYREGTLLSASGGIFASDRLPDGSYQKRGFATWTTFVNLGYKIEEAMSVPANSLPAANGSLIGPW